MAEIVQSLFGITPDMYQQSQQARADQQAMQYARLSPFEQANFAIGRGANMLGGVIGRGLGGEDPELARITARQQISGQINYADPASIARGVEMLQQAGDGQGAMMLADVYRKAESERALAEQRLAAGRASDASAKRERFQADPEKVRLARAVAATKGIEGSPEYNTAYNESLEKQMTPSEKEPRFGDLRESVAGELFNNKSFFQLTPSEKAVVNKKVDEQTRATARESAPKFALPGQDKLVEIPKFRADVQKTIEKPLASISAADQALLAIDDSIKTNNFVSFNAARVQLAKALGDSQLSRRDIEQAGGDPSLFGSLLDSTSTLFTSTPSLDTQNQIKKTLQAVRTLSAKKANTEVERQRKIAIAAGYPTNVVEMALTFDDLLPPTTASPISGDVAAQARAILEQRKKGSK